MNEVKAVVLAAGKGTRMQSEQCNLPKVLREAWRKPLLHYVLSALDFIPRENTILVVGYQREKVMDAFPGYPQPYRSPRWAPATPCSAPGRFPGRFRRHGARLLRRHAAVAPGGL